MVLNSWGKDVVLLFMNIGTMSTTLHQHGIPFCLHRILVHEHYNNSFAIFILDSCMG